jgi:hypothetical protein
LKDLKARAHRAAANTQLLEDSFQAKGLPVDQNAKLAITQGGQAVKDEAKEIINSTASATVKEVSTEDIDVSAM